jgi:hypothetical protein
MKRIISVSRRTDIPAFYGDWFMGRLAQGFVGVENPFSGQKYLISLKTEDVVCFVFWSKNFAPFLDNLRIIERMGYKFYFNYTITCLPEVFESNVNKDTAIKTLKQLSRTYSPKHINWRFDPIIISNVAERDFYIKGFKELANQFEGLVERCYISFVTQYEKVKRNFADLEKSKGITVTETSNDSNIELANELAEIAGGFGIQIYSCCGDYLVNEKVKKAHCIDGHLIEQLLSLKGFSYSIKPTRQDCGCTESTDIGAYDTCPHGCVYCYANANKHKAYEAFRNHDKNSAFLACTKVQSEKWLEEIKTFEGDVNYLFEDFSLRFHQ